MNQNCFELNPSYNPNYSGFDRPPQYPIDQSPPHETSIQDLEVQKQQYLDEMLSISIQIQIKDYRNERIDICYRRECEIKIDELKSNFNKMSIEIIKIEKELPEQAANVSTHTPEPSRRFNFIYDNNDDDEESAFPLNEIISQLPPSIAITSVLPIMEPEDSFIMENEDLSTIPEKESDEFIKYSVEDFVPIPIESEDTSGSDIDLPSCDDFSPINVYEEKSVTFSNLLFDSNDNFTSSDDESLSDEDNIESKDSYVSNLDELDLLVTPFSDANTDKCFDPGGDIDEIELLLHHDSSTPKLSVSSILEGFTDESPLEENDDLFDLKSKENEWKKILYDAPIDDLMIEDKVFDPRIHEKTFSPTYVSLPFEDSHYLSLTYVIRIFLPYFTYPVESSLPLSSGSEDIIFDPGIFAYSFYSLERVAYECPMELISDKLELVDELIRAFKSLFKQRTKSVFITKMDENGVVIRNKARLVVQGYRQEEGIGYDETFSPVARLEAIMIFLACAAYMGFVEY
ncbi:hypothetical protein Tco_0299047 [Tanacetum coccineum]